VACWNKSNGCAFSGSCVDVLNHFERECEFHVTWCNTCEARVLRNDVVKHLKSACSFHVIQCADTERATSTSESDQQAHLETKQLLEKIRDDHLGLQSSFNELSERVQTSTLRLRNSSEAGLMTVVDLVGEINASLCSVLQESIVNCKSHVSTEVSVLRERLSQATRNLLCSYVHLSSAPRKQTWVLDDWRDIFTRASQCAEFEDESPLMSVRGYSMCLHIKIRTRIIGFYCVIHPGPIDDELEWPFRSVLTFCVVHPKDETKTITTRKDPTEYTDRAHFQRPVSGPNTAFRITYVGAPFLENRGFADIDKLCLSIEIL
ncbi:unnamed protein product, partial [Ixodes hexagonus]